MTPEYIEILPDGTRRVVKYSLKKHAKRQRRERLSEIWRKRKRMGLKKFQSTLMFGYNSVSR